MPHLKHLLLAAVCGSQATPTGAVPKSCATGADPTVKKFYRLYLLPTNGANGQDGAQQACLNSTFLGVQGTLATARNEADLGRMADTMNCNSDSDTSYVWIGGRRELIQTHYRWLNDNATFYCLNQTEYFGGTCTENPPKQPWFKKTQPKNGPGMDDYDYPLNNPFVQSDLGPTGALAVCGGLDDAKFISGVHYWMDAPTGTIDPFHYMCEYCVSNPE